MSSRPFRLLVVADDRKMLRRLSRFLGVFGFHVDSVADAEKALVVFEANPPDFLIVDGDTTDLPKCRSLFSDSGTSYTYSLLMVGKSDLDGLTEAIQAGVDDFLAKPLVLGELLARLRSGARVLEYERRIRQQSAIEPVTALLAQPAFLSRVESELRSATNETVSCVVIDLDFFEHITKSHGRAAGEEVLRAVTAQFKSLAVGCKYLASFGAGRFAAVLPGASDAKALAWSETVREAIECLEVMVDGKPVTVTASLGVAGTMHGSSSSHELIERAEEAVRLAKISGRNCVARCGQFDGETREWEDLARQGRLFDTTTTRDVMIPLPILAREEHDIRQTAALLQQSGLNEIPVVDRKGDLVGLFGVDQLPVDHGASSGWRVKVGDMMDRNVATVSEETTFSELMEFFMAENASNHLVVVVRRDRPLGIVYRSSLAALSEPLTTASFAPSEPFSASSDYLLVTEA